MTSLRSAPMRRVLGGVIPCRGAVTGIGGIPLGVAAETVFIGLAVTGLLQQCIQLFFQKNQMIRYLF